MKEMAWYERVDHGKATIWIVERRGAVFWTKSGLAGAKGRLQTFEHRSEEEAIAAMKLEVEKRLSEGFSLVSEAGGVSAPLRSSARPGSKTRNDLPGIGEFVRELERGIASLTSRATLHDAFEVVHELARKPKAFRTKGFFCDLGVRGQASLGLQIRSEENHWREVGFHARFDVPDETETEEERIDAETGGWKGFCELLLSDPAWLAVAQLRCTSVELLDDEID